MKPSKDEDALVDVLDVVLRDGAILRADVIVSVAEIPLVGIKLTAAIAGMETMTDYGLFEEWDATRRKAAVARRQDGHRRDRLDDTGERDAETSAIDRAEREGDSEDEGARTEQNDRSN